MRSFVHLLVFLAPVGMAAMAASAAVGLFFKFFGKDLKNFTPVAQFRIVFAAAVLPVLIGATFFIAATAGWAIHGETDLCLARAKSGHLSSFLAVFSMIFIALLTVRLATLVSRVRKEYQFRKLMEKSAVRRFGIFRLVPLREPQAFVLGLINPKIYLSRALFEKFDKNSLKAIIAHERTHVLRRDPLRRLLASLALIFHLPPVSSKINGQLALIQELIADNAAAQTSCRLNLAEILVGFARMRVTRTAAAFEFGNRNIEIRVRRLLDAGENSAKISLAAFAFFGFALLTGAIVFSRQMHLLYELILSIY